MDWTETAHLELEKIHTEFWSELKSLQKPVHHPARVLLCYMFSSSVLMHLMFAPSERPIWTHEMNKVYVERLIVVLEVSPRTFSSVQLELLVSSWTDPSVPSKSPGTLNVFHLDSCCVLPSSPRGCSCVWLLPSARTHHEQDCPATCWKLSTSSPLIMLSVILCIIHSFMHLLIYQHFIINTDYL